VLITSQKEFDDGVYSVEIAVYGKKMYITAINIEAHRKFIVEVPEQKGNRIISAVFDEGV
jgi:hypothetical protein